MDSVGVIKALALIGSYWPNAKIPTTDGDVKIAVEAWMTLLKTVPNEEVLTEIARIASEGRGFAPNVGQIYAAVKAGREERKAFPSNNPIMRMYEAYAERYHSHGRPTMGEYFEQGHTTAEWLRLVGDVINA